jgi:biotin carboxylase
MTVAAFVAPYLLPATSRFIAAAAGLPGVQLALITQEPLERVPEHLVPLVTAHWRVDDALDADQLVTAVEGLRAQGGDVGRLLGPLEQLQVPLAIARQRLGIPGMEPQTAHNFRDKSQMKDVLRAAGLPCAGHRLVDGIAAAQAFVAEVGFPLVAKPPAGAGARETFRLDSAGDLADWLSTAPPTPERPVLLEEFLTGEELTFDSVTIGGQVVWASIAHYLPTPLEVLHNPWMQWVVLLPREIDGPEYAPIRKAGPAALSALGLRDGLTHLEWFRRPDGGIAISEVAARPPGAQITSMISYVHDFDLYEAWARLMILGDFDPPQRRWAAGAVFVRAQGAGTVRAIHGAESLQEQIGGLVVEVKLPQPGQQTSGTYEGEGYVIVRHAETAVVVDALQRIVTGLRVEVA